MKEEEIRPKKIFNKYLELSSKDGHEISKKELSNINCPACNKQDKSNILYSKNNFNIKSCLNCNTLFCSPRPTPKELEWLYKDSTSSKYWANTFFPTVSKIRQKKLFKQKAKQIHKMITDLNFYPNEICDVGAGHGVFTEELSKHFTKSIFYCLEPNPEMALICKEKNFHTIENTIENLKTNKNQFDLVLSSEVFEHVYSPKKFLKQIYNIVKPNGFCLITTLNCEGYDIQILKEKSKSISPPHHLNFFSLKGFEILFKNIGFSEITISTPGKIDLDIVLNSTYSDTFSETIKSRGTKSIKEFQKFLQKNLLSSHTWILAKK